MANLSNILTPSNILTATNIQTVANKTFTDQVKVTSGSLATPAVSSSVDLDTGLYFPASDTVGFSTGGVENLRVNTTGVGIGTSSPGAKLDVYGGASGTVTNIQVGNAATAFLVGVDGANNCQLRTAQSVNMLFYTAALERMRLDPSGNLGLGVTPSAWGNQGKAIEVGNSAFYQPTYGVGNQQLQILKGAYTGQDTAFRYSVTGQGVTAYIQIDREHRWLTAPSGTAGNPISFTQAMTLDAIGNLALGRTSVSTIGNDFRTVDLDGLNGSGIRFRSNGTSIGFVYSAGTSFLDFGTTGAYPLTFTTNGTERARITSGGNLLVGTTSDSYGRVAVTGGQISLVTDTASHRRIGFWSTANGISENAYIQVQNDGATTNTGEILLATKDNGGTLAERARITSGGYFMASNTGSYISGVTNFNGPYHVFLSDQNSETFDVGNSNTGSSVVNIYSYLQSGATGKHYGAVLAGSVVYQVLANGNVQNLNNSYGAISDLKLKENITDATPKLASLNQLRVVNYNLKTDPGFKQIGLIAQEVEQVFPGLVESTPDLDPETKEPTGTVTKAVKYSVLVPMLLKAVQELTARLEALESQ